MTLDDICTKIANIEMGLEFGEIAFTYTKLMCAMKPQPPQEILDDILSEIGWDVCEGKEISLDRVKEWLKKLVEFKKAFRIKEMNSPIKDIQEYIRLHEE